MHSVTFWPVISRWTPPGCTPGELVTQILAEHEAVHGEAVGWTLTFNGEVDSAGLAWPTIPILPTQVGDSLPTVLERLAEAWIDFGQELGTDGRTLSMPGCVGLAATLAAASSSNSVNGVNAR